MTPERLRNSFTSSFGNREQGSNWNLQLLLICALAFAIRIVSAALLPNVAHADETFQYLEQANRLLTGRGLVPWEYQVGARSWIIPGFFAGILQIGRWLTTNPAGYLWAATAFMCILSLAATIASYRLGCRAGGPVAGLFAASLVAFWPEAVYLSTHVLADTLAAAALILAISTCYGKQKNERSNFFIAGLLLGLTLVVRIQLAPGIVVTGLCLVFGKEFLEKAIFMALGVLLPVLLLGVVDWLTWGQPFFSVLRYVQVNLGGVAVVFGASHPLYYFGKQVQIWHVITPLIVFTSLTGAKRAPMLAVTALCIVITFSLIGHKESRFIFPAIMLLLILCGIGTADILEKWTSREGALQSRTLVSLAMMLWITGALAVGIAPVMKSKWKNESATLKALSLINADNSACGIGIAQPDLWWKTGLVYIRDDLQLFEAIPSQLTAASGPFTHILDYEPLKNMNSYAAHGYVVLRCFSGDQLCVYRRPGTCENTGLEKKLEARMPDGVYAALKRLRFL